MRVKIYKCGGQLLYNIQSNMTRNNIVRVGAMRVPNDLATANSEVAYIRSARGV